MNYTLEAPKISFNPNFLNGLNLPQFISQQALTTRTRLLADTVAGKTAEGGGLKPYSPSYSAWKQQKTGSSQVNLTVTGEMLRSIVLAKTADGAELRLQGQHAPSKSGSGRPVGNTNVKRASGNSTKAKSASPAKAATRAKSTGKGGGVKVSAKSRRGKSASASNALIAQAQYAMGRGGWFTIGKQDIERITKEFNSLLDKQLKSAIDTK